MRDLKDPRSKISSQQGKGSKWIEEEGLNEPCLRAELRLVSRTVFVRIRRIFQTLVQKHVFLVVPFRKGRDNSSACSN